jgi:hypothetical protein
MGYWEEAQGELRAAGFYPQQTIFWAKMKEVTAND